jgi:hypothetical protein
MKSLNWFKNYKSIDILQSIVRNLKPISLTLNVDLDFQKLLEEVLREYQKQEEEYKKTVNKQQMELEEYKKTVDKQQLELEEYKKKDELAKQQLKEALLIQNLNNEDEVQSFYDNHENLAIFNISFPKCSARDYFADPLFSLPKRNAYTQVSEQDIKTILGNFYIDNTAGARDPLPLVEIPELQPPRVFLNYRLPHLQGYQFWQATPNYFKDGFPKSEDIAIFRVRAQERLVRNYVLRADFFDLKLIHRLPHYSDY